MDTTGQPGDGPYRVAIGVVAVLGLYQGVFALLGRALFDRDQRFAPALWLPAPWWWVACLGVSALALVLLVVLDDARPPSPSPSSSVDDAAAAGGGPGDAPTGGYDALSGVVFLVGLYNGVAPFVAWLLFDGDLLLALPLRVGAPWWWIASLVVLAVTVGLLGLIDRAKQAVTRGGT